MKPEGRTEVVTRRDFLRGSAYGTLALALGLKGSEHAAGLAFAAENPVSRVVLIRDERAVDRNHRINPNVVAEMLDAAMKAFTGESDVRAAWQHFVRSEDTVGIKLTRCSWHRIHTEQAVIDAIRARVTGAGVAERKVHADDYGLPFKECTALISVPSVKVHSLTGIAASIKNYINLTGKESSYHHEGSVKLGEAWLLPEVKGKTRLIVVDALRPYFGPGPQINPLHRWDYKGILAGIDPVAIDTTCLRICQAKRNLFKGEEWVITPPPKSVAAADTVYHLGTSDPLKIQVIRHGWDKGRLI